MTIESQAASTPGFYEDAAGVPRWWNGAQWTAKVRADTAVPSGLKLERLGEQIELFVRGGYRVESVAGFQAVVARPRRVATPRNAVLVVLTAGLWLVPMVYRAKHRSWHRVVLTVDDTGAVRFI